MAQFDIYIDTNVNQVVAGILSANTVALPPFVQGDTPNLRIWPLVRTPTFPLLTPYAYIGTAGLSLEAALGDKIGNVTNYYATQFAWTPDPANGQFWSAAFPLNTTPINNLIGANSSAQTTFEVKLLAGGIPTTILSVGVTVQAAVIKAGGVPQVPAGLTPLSAEYANATFLTRQIAGAFYLFNPTTGKKMACYLGNDGEFHAEQVN